MMVDNDCESEDEEIQEEVTLLSLEVGLAVIENKRSERESESQSPLIGI